MTGTRQQPLLTPGNGPVVLAAGGTGGHLFPALALARVLLARGYAVHLITDTRGKGFGAELPEVTTHRISGAGVAGGSPVKKAKSLLLLGWGYLQARRLLSHLKPQAVVGFGGYAALPTSLAALHQKRRTLLHEQNQVVGRANRLLAEKATAIATSFARVDGLSAAAQSKTQITGNPVRAAIADLAHSPYPAVTGQQALQLLVTGGSQGATVFNDLLPAAIARLPEELRQRLTICQQVRGGDEARLAGLYDSCGVGHTLKSFFDDMPQRLATAHLLVCRSGASTIAELAAAGRPAVLVPYPYATDDHQTGNARAFAEAGGGWLMPQSDLTADSLAQRLGELLASPDTLSRAAACARAFAQPNAAERLADLVCGQTPGNGENGKKKNTPDNPQQEAAA
ncbi:undecaprenyldiphospho-muramoylpentapeptide beta-N-acetylglucosaminyltransferase [Rhodovibrionaceae bacterium A322]